VSAFLSKTFDVSDLPEPTFGSLIEYATKGKVINWPVKLCARFLRFFSKIRKHDF